MNPTEIFSAPLLPEATRPACVWGEARVVDGTLAIDCVQQTPYGAVRLDSRSWPLPPVSTLAVIGGKANPPETLGSAVTAYVTAYYCSRVPGWPLGDGGGYCGAMANGVPVHWGAAACGYYWKLGAVLIVEGYGVVTCEDRGLLGHTQVDIFMPTNADVYASGILSTYHRVMEVP